MNDEKLKELLLGHAGELARHDGTELRPVHLVGAHNNFLVALGRLRDELMSALSRPAPIPEPPAADGAAAPAQHPAPPPAAATLPNAAPEPVPEQVPAPPTASDAPPSDAPAPAPDQEPLK